MWYIYFAIFVAFCAVAVFIPGEMPDFDIKIFDRNNTKVYKGLAITIIILAHYMNEFGHGVRLFTPLGGIGVAIFLVLSGYGLNESWLKCEEMVNGGGTDTSQPYDKWWQKRIVSVFIPYAIVQLIFYWPFHRFDIVSFLMDLTCINPLYHNGWYLNHLLLMYIMFYCVHRVKILRNNKLLIYTVVSALILLFAPELHAEQAFSFATGIAISCYKEHINTLLKIRNVIILMILGVSFLVIKQLPLIRQAPQFVMNCVQLLIKLPLGLAFIALTYYLGKRIKLFALNQIGLISYELYLIHGYCLKIWNQSIMDAILFIVVSALLSVVFWKGYRIIRDQLSVKLKLR